MALLEVDDIHTAYGSIEALKGVSLKVDEGEVVTLIGSNGAGKSTTLRSISGLTPPQAGSIRFRGEEISTMPAQEIVRLGISQSPEGRRCFQRMTRAREPRARRLPAPGRQRREDLDRVFELFPRLKEREKQKAGTMSGGEQQMLAMGRALMADPTLLLLDEPSMGLAPILVDRIYETVARDQQQGTTILLVEQNANYALEVSTRGYVLETGRSACRTIGRAPREPRSPEGVPRNMTVFALLGATALWLTYAWLRVGDRRLLPVRPQGLRRAPGPRERPAAQRDRRPRSGWSARPRPSRCGRSPGPWGAASSRTRRPPRRRTPAAPSRRRPPPPSAAWTGRRRGSAAAAAGSRHGPGTGTAASDCPPSPARGVTLHHTSSPRR